VVDAYRASTTIAVLVQKGARVVPVASIEEAAGYPGADFRIGERGSAKVKGFDFGNSPTEVAAAEMKPGSTVALSTTNGTRLSEAAEGAPASFSGAFVNARAIAGALQGGAHGTRVVVVGCGWEGHRSSEDEAAAGAILHHLSESGAESTSGRSGSWASTTGAPRTSSRGTRRHAGCCASATRETLVSASPKTPSPLSHASPEVPSWARGADSPTALACGPIQGRENTQICSQN
jgi:phosphosulfolactate phosphohydrolase-like enzyme